MAEINTDKNSLPKSPTELEKVALTFSSLFSLARACARGDIAPLIERASLYKTGEAALGNSFYFKNGITKNSICVKDFTIAVKGTRDLTPSL